MLIDWFTLGAQAVNFIILVWLLKRFLYKPILRAVDERERRIAAQLEEAAATKADAQKQQEEYRQKLATFEVEREALLKKATADAEAERQRLTGEARTEVESLRARWRAALVNEQQSLGSDLSRKIQAEVFAIARKTLGDLAGIDLETRVVERFIRRLREASPTEKSALQAAFEARTGTALVRSALELPPAQRQAIEAAVREHLAVKAPVRFEITPDAIGGLELIANGHKVAWSMADYLTALEREVRGVIEDQRETATHGGRSKDEPVG